MRARLQRIRARLPSRDHRRILKRSHIRHGFWRLALARAGMCSATASAGGTVVGRAELRGTRRSRTRAEAYRHALRAQLGPCLRIAPQASEWSSLTGRHRGEGRVLVRGKSLTAFRPRITLRGRAPQSPIVGQVVSRPRLSFCANQGRPSPL